MSFEVSPIQNNRRISIYCEAPIHDRRIVKSSNGSSEKRYVIKATLGLGEHSWEIELTLTNRDSMGYRMLLGREAMSGKALVDPEASYCLKAYNNEEIKNFYSDNTIEKSGLKIGLLASNPFLYSNQRIIEAGEERGHKMEFLNIRHCYMKLDANLNSAFYRGGKLLNDLDAVIPRIKPAMTFYGCALVRQFEGLDIFSLNSSSAIKESRDKL